MPPRPKKFLCPFKLKDINYIDYKDSKMLSEYITFYRSIQSRFRTGTSLKMQKQLARAVKRARFMGLLSYVRYVKKDHEVA
jgi:small subunit ribosomal protein S18